jgi:hypothetical protein
MASLVTTTASAAPTALLTPTPELGQLKVCKVAGSGVVEGTLFTFRVNGNSYSVPAGPADRNGYCILAGQYPVGSEITIEEVIPDGYYVSRIEVKPDRTVSKDTPGGIVTVRIVSGVIEASFTNKVAGSPTPTRTPTSVHTSTPRPTNTPPSCAPNCTPTSTPIPMGRLQICKEAEGPGVTGSFTFRFETRSRTIPVGACAGLIAVNAGTLTITETAQAGYSVADIYTIPADRLISKDLATGVATVRIVEGTAASQTIVIFRNRATATTHTSTPTGFVPATATHTATPTSTGSVTPTFTPTATGSATATSTATPTASVTPTATATTPPSVCPPAVIYANFNNVPVDQSVEGLGVVAPYLNIQAKRTALRVGQAEPPAAYFAPPGSPNVNGGLVADGGFSDIETKDLREPHQYTFTFASGVSISHLSVHMLDYGDWNPTSSTSHYASMTAYDAGGNVVSKEELSYTTLAVDGPRSSDLYGDLQLNGDAVTAPPGQPGNWIWNVAGNGIVRVVLEFREGHDPNIAFDLLSFTTECASCQSLFSANFSSVPASQSVEGLGVVAPHLDINAKRTALRVVQATDPLTYFAPNGSANINGGLAGDGGFSDIQTKDLFEYHQYTFTFAPGVTVTNFSLHMLDYGDWNYLSSTSHSVIMTAYNASGNVVSKEEINYTTPAVEAPRTSSLYGDLYLNGDAVSAPLGQPGNWIWNVAGNGIVRVVLEFGEGHDPNIAFDLLSYNVVCQ